MFFAFTTNEDRVRDARSGGDFHIKKARVLVRNFEKNS